MAQRPLNTLYNSGFGPPNPNQPLNQVPQGTQLPAPTGWTFDQFQRVRVEDNRRSLFAAIANENDPNFLKEVLDLIVTRLNAVIQVKENVCWHTDSMTCPFADYQQKESNNQLQEVDQDVNIQHQDQPIEELKEIPLMGYKDKSTPTGRVMIDSGGLNTNLPESWVSVTKGTIPITYSNKPKKVLEVKNGPNIRYQNPVSDNDIGQIRPGLRPRAIDLNVGNIIGNDDYVIVRHPPFKTPERPPKGLVFQRKRDGLFYTSNGRCIRTDTNGFILTFGTGGNYFVGHWADPNAQNKTNQRYVDPSLLKEKFKVRDELLKKFDLKQIKNPNWKPNNGQPREITVDKDGKFISRDKFPELDECLKDIHQTLRSGTRIKRVRHIASTQSRSLSPRKFKPNVREVSYDTSYGKRDNPQTHHNKVITEIFYSKPVINVRPDLQGSDIKSEEIENLAASGKGAMIHSEIISDESGKITQGNLEYARVQLDEKTRISLSKEEYNLNQVIQPDLDNTTNINNNISNLLEKDLPPD